MEQENEAKVSLDACFFKHLGTWSTNRWYDKDGRGTIRFDAPERWKVDGSICRAIGATRHVPRTISQTLEKKVIKGCKPNEWMDPTPTLWTDGQHWWAGAIVVTGDERNKGAGARGGNYKYGIP